MKYLVGDDITTGISVSHVPHLIGIDVVFRHLTDDSIAITLTGVPELVSGKPDFRSDGIEIKRSYAELSAEVELGHIPGHYEMRTIVFYTASGQDIEYEGVDANRFSAFHILEVVAEPNSVEAATIYFPDEHARRQSVEDDA